MRRKLKSLLNLIVWFGVIGGICYGLWVYGDGRHKHHSAGYSNGR